MKTLLLARTTSSVSLALPRDLLFALLGISPTFWRPIPPLSLRPSPLPKPCVPSRCNRITLAGGRLPPVCRRDGGCRRNQRWKSVWLWPGIVSSGSVGFRSPPNHLPWALLWIEEVLLRIPSSWWECKTRTISRNSRRFSGLMIMHELSIQTYD